MKNLQENLKLFYLGLENGEPFLYKNKDLTTHALIIGMTGSGKTGLGVTLLEEACIDNIPSIVIDPKGDLTNLALSFQNLSADEFLPFMDENEAVNKGISVQELANETAQIWKKGLQDSYQDISRVKLFKDSADVRIYTPKSSAGLGVSLLSNFKAPQNLDDEAMNNYVLNLASSVLSLAKIGTDDVNSPEMLLLEQIFLENFANGKDLSINELITQIATPPFEKIGVFDVQTFFPNDKRMAFAMKINALVANPSFKQWLNGEPLNIGKMLFDENGKARCNIFTISHLNDDERMFFVTILLNEMISWMRTTEGTSSLRAVFYMDEIFGFFPPSSNPPSKKPTLTLLKQARAFGLGCVLSTQNPVDIDYKGLSNIGTWFIGRLQTAQDKDRVISGLSGVNGADFTKSEILELLSNIEKRSFLVKNINESGLKVISSRFALSYLKGPLNADQISALMKNKIQINVPKFHKNTGVKPIISNEIPQLFSGSGELSANLYATAKIRYTDKNLDYTKDIHLCFDLDGASNVDWSEASDREIENLSQSDPEDAKFEEIPSFISSLKNFKNLQNDFKEFLYRNTKLSLFSALDLNSNPKESKEEFYVRLSDRANEILESKTDEITKKFNKEKSRIEARIRTAQQRLEKEKAGVLKSGIDAAISIGTAIFGSLLGSRSSSIGKIATSARSANRVLNERKDVKNASENLEVLLNQMDEMTAKFNDEINELKDSLDLQKITLDIKEILPKKSDIYDEKIYLLWKS